MKHYAAATWKGNGLDGAGSLTVQSQSLVRTRFTFDSRFNTNNGTNTEELLAAAHASDFTMKLSFVLTEAGYKTKELNTTCYINFDRGEIVSSALELIADIEDIEQDVFEECVKEANDYCPMTRILKLNVSIDARLVTPGTDRPDIIAS